MKAVVISTHYPNHDYIYGDVFVHTRLKQYKNFFEVVVIGYNQTLANDRRYEYESIQVNIVNQLDRFFYLLENEKPDVIIGHLVQYVYIDFLLQLKKPLVFFFHGFEITSWKRRMMNYTSVGDVRYLLPYIIENTRQLKNVKKLIKEGNKRSDVKFIFVSHWLKAAAEYDLNISIQNSYVIPNGINVDLFAYKQKTVDDRKKILLIRSFKAINYANDIAIDAILKLSEKEYFQQFEISIYGEGYLFYSLTEKVKHLPNVTVNNFFVENKNIPQIHAKHGIFLCPSRLDTQGVSMCEAMASGLVPITSGIGGIPEYCTNGKSGFLTNSIDEIVSKIDLLYSNPDLFLKMSAAAREAVMTKCNVNIVVADEIKIIQNLSKTDAGEMGQMNTSYKQCARCVLDTNDNPEITFNTQGICSYCTGYDEQEKTLLRSGNQLELAQIVQNIKNEGKGNRYDCILGLSGGVDSTYVALQAKNLGLRPLIVHFDNGWNSELAVSNIEKTINKLGFELYTLVVQWEEFRDLQLAFLKASVIDIEMVTDHAIVATLYKLAIKNNIKFILSGTNIVTEGVLPLNWIHHKADYIHIRAIQKQFVGKPLKTYPLLRVALRVRAELMGITSISLLNYLDYNKENAKKELIRELDWRDYGGKHYESVFTRFYQGYILPHKFKVDKRKAHLSTLICSGQITREAAMAELRKPIYNEDLLRADYDFVIKKLGLTKNEFEQIMAQSPIPHNHYPVEENIYERYPFLKIFKAFWQAFKKGIKNDRNN